MCQKDQGGNFLIKKKKKSSIEVCRKAPFLYGRTKLTPPLCKGLWRCPPTPATSGIRLWKVCEISPRLPEIRFTPKETPSHGCSQQPRSTNGFGRAGDAGNTQLFSCPASPGRTAAADGPAEGKEKVKREKKTLRGCASPAAD